MELTDVAPQDLPGLIDRLRPLRERLLADLILLAQTPSPTGEEERRVRFVLDRMIQSGVQSVGRDQAGNAIGVIYGIQGDEQKRRTIKIVAHCDSAVPAGAYINVTVESDRVVGTGVSGTALGLSVLCCLPEALETLGITFQSDIALLGTVRSQGRANENGLTAHLKEAECLPDFGLVLEGLPLGKLNSFSIGSLRGRIACDTSDSGDVDFGLRETAIVVITRILNRLLRIPRPRRPFTDIRFLHLHAGAGTSQDVEPDLAELSFDVVSYGEDIITDIRSQIEDIVAEMAARYTARVELDFFRSRRAGGLSYHHPLVKRCRAIMEALDIEPVQSHTAAELANFIQHDIPAVTLGLTRGRRLIKRRDYALIDPIITGLVQLIGVLLEIDRGNCDEA